MFAHVHAALRRIRQDLAQLLEPATIETICKEMGHRFRTRPLQQGDGGAEVVVEGHQQVDVVEVLLAAEAVGEVVARVDRGPHLAAVRAEEAEVVAANFTAIAAFFRAEKARLVTMSPNAADVLRRTSARKETRE